MTDQGAITAALSSCYDDFESLITDLDAGEWDVQSLCPDWNVKGVATHVAGIETVLVDWRPQSGDEPPPFSQMGEFLGRAADMSGPELAEHTVKVLADRRAELAVLTPAEWSLPCMTPVGPGNYGRFMEVRIFDLWIHQRDMTVPLGRSTLDSGPAAEVTLDEVHNSLGYIVGKKIGLPDGMSLAFHLTGAIERDMYVEVDGRARVVESLVAPSLELSADSTTFLLLAAGRIDPQGEIDAERIGWTGADEWGDRAARNLSFTF